MASRISMVVGLAFTLAALTAVARPAEAQGVSVTPFLGVYLPVSNVASEDDFGVDVKQSTGLAFGGRLTYMMQGGNWGIEGEVAYASSKLDFGDVEGDGGSVIFAGAKAMYFFPSASNFRIHAGGGIGITSRGGDDWEGADESSTFGGILNLGFTTPLSGMMKLRVDIEDYIGSISPEEGLDSQLQNDLLITAGVMIPFGGN
jgi:hypothetical protein